MIVKIPIILVMSHLYQYLMDRHKTKNVSGHVLMHGVDTKTNEHIQLYSDPIINNTMTNLQV